MNIQKQIVSDLSQHVLHVHAKEWPRIVEAWLIRFLYQVGFIVAWTMITALIVDKLGLAYLPALYIGHSIFVVIGSVVFRQAITYMRNRTLLIYIASLCSLGLIGTSLLIDNSSLWFILSLLFCLGVFFNQMYLGLLKFIESLFSPSENERTYPIIETAEPIGGTVGGFLLYIGAHTIHTYAFIYVWLFCTLAIIPIILHFYRKKHKFIELHTDEEHRAKHEDSGHFFERFRYIKASHFLWALTMVIFFHWMFVHMLHFQVTKAVSLSTDHHGGKDALTHGIGAIHMTISLGMLLVQLLLSSRIMKRFGAITSMQISPFFSTLSTLGMLFFFNYGTAVLAQGLHEINNVFGTQGYHSTYYALGEHIREKTREFLEAVIRPLGILAGTILLIIYGLLPTDWAQNIAIHSTLIALCLTNFITLRYMKKEYSFTVKKQLDLPGDHEEKLHAIDLLGQRGHEISLHSLITLLQHPHESVRVKVQALRALAHLNDSACLQDVLSMVESPLREVQKEALLTIGTFSQLGASFFTQAFSRYRVVDMLTSLYKKDTDREIRAAIISVFAHMRESSIISLLLADLEQKNDPDLQANTLKLIGMFHDSTIAHYIEPYLDDTSDVIRAAAFVALWQFPHLHKKLSPYLHHFFSDAQNTERIISGMYVIASTEQKSEYQKILPFLHHKNWEIRAYASTTLAKLGFDSVLGIIIQLLLTHNMDVATKTHSLIKNLGKQMHNKLQILLERHINALMQLEYGFVKEIRLSALTSEQLERLHFFYRLLGFEHELVKVEIEQEKRKE